MQIQINFLPGVTSEQPVMNNTLGFALAIKEEKTEYYEEFDSKDFLNNYPALSKVNPFMKTEPKIEHDVQTLTTTDIRTNYG